MDSDSRVKIFYSYSHRDEGYREELETHLSILRRKNIIDEWHDRKIEPGGKWRLELKESLSAADVVLLLVSPDFLASDFCYEEEMMRVLDQHADGQIVVIPIIIRPVDFEDSPFAELQALPTDAVPVTRWENKDEAWLTVARGIRKTCESRLRQSFGATGEVRIDGGNIEVDISHEVDEGDFGVVDFNAMIEEQMAYMVEAQQVLAERTNQMGCSFNESTEKINRLNSYKGRDRARRILDVTKAMGEDLGKYGRDMMKLSDKIETSWADVDRVFPLLLNMFANEHITEDGRKELEGLVQTLESTGLIIGSLVENMDGALEAIFEVSKHSAHLKVGGRPATNGLSKLRDVFWGVQSSIGQMHRSAESILDGNSKKKISIESDNLRWPD